MTSRIALLLFAAALFLAACGGTAATPDEPAAQDAPSAAEAQADLPDTLRIGVGPLLPTPEDTEAAWDPFFSWLAGELGVDYELTATTDWAGIAVAMGNDQLDLAWMGPFGFVLANDSAGAEAIATALYDGRPIYHAIIVGRPDLQIDEFPRDAEGLSISFADAASTSGWLIPTHWFQEQDIDPATFFSYSEGATHSANEVAVANGQVDLATDFDRNRNAMIEMGTIAEDATQVVWESDPLPNDAIAVRAGFDPALADRIRELLVALTPEEAAEILPEHYTGFVEATVDSYAPIRDAAVEVGVLE